MGAKGVGVKVGATSEGAKGEGAKGASGRGGAAASGHGMRRQRRLLLCGAGGVALLGLRPLSAAAQPAASAQPATSTPPVAAVDGAASGASAGGAARGELLAALRAGGLVVLLRHGATERGGVDRIEWPRAQQRLLSARGQAQARAIGAAFERHRLPVGEVLASPFARCHDTAQLAFGRVRDEPLLLGLLSEGSGHAPRLAYLRGKLGEAVADGANRILVSHASNAAQATGLDLPEGGAAIVRPGGAAPGYAVLGSLGPDDWVALAATVTAPMPQGAR